VCFGDGSERGCRGGCKMTRKGLGNVIIMSLCVENGTIESFSFFLCVVEVSISSSMGGIIQYGNGTI
jgi:hypothetical protein